MVLSDQFNKEWCAIFMTFGEGSMRLYAVGEHADRDVPRVLWSVYLVFRTEDTCCGIWTVCLFYNAWFFEDCEEFHAGGVCFWIRDSSQLGSGENRTVAWLWCRLLITDSEGGGVHEGGIFSGIVEGSYVLTL